MSWDDIKKGAAKVGQKADGFRTSAMNKIDHTSSPRARSGSDAAANESPSAPPPRHLPPRAGGASSPARPVPSVGAHAPANPTGGSGVFTNLSEEDKEALFVLLDEYFESRPHLLAAGAEDAASAPNGQNDTVSAMAAKHGPALASAAMRNPALTSAALRSQGVSPGFANSISNAAASAAKKPPVPPPSSASSTSAAAPVAPQRGPKGAAGLTTGRSLAGMPTSSGKAAFGHILTTTGKEKPPPDTSFANTAAIAPRAAAQTPPGRSAIPPPPPSRSHGIGRATALYDFQGTDPGDLSFVAGDEINILEQISDDWQRGELTNGQTGIYPVNYVEQQ